MIDQRALEAAAHALANIHQFNGIPDECRDDALRIIEAYEAARFGDVELERRSWFCAHFDFHRAIGQGKEIDDALWEAIQAYVGHKALEDEKP